MARIAGVDPPRNKRHGSAFTYIFGIGNPRALRILAAANVDPFKKIQDLGEDEVTVSVRSSRAKATSKADLRKDVSMHIKRLIDIQSYRGTAAPAAAFPCADSAPTPMRAPVRDRVRAR